MATQDRNPTSDISASGTWTGTAGSRYTLIDDHPDSGGTDVLTHGTTAGNIVLGFTAFSVPAGATISAVRVIYYDRKSANQACNIAGRIAVNGTQYAASSHNPTNGTLVLRTDEWTTNPNTGAAWTVDDVNGSGAAPLQSFGFVSSDASPTISLSSAIIQVEYNEAITGSMAAVESGSDTFAASGTVSNPDITGTMTAAESGSDTFAANGTVEWPEITGTLAATESGSDTFAASGTVEWPEITGSLAADESGSDTFAASGTVEWPEITGTMTASESGSDIFSASGFSGDANAVPLYPLADLPVADIPVEANEVLGVLLTSLGLDQIVTGKVQVKAASSDVLFTGSATGTVQVKAASINSLGLNSTETGKVIVKGVESNTLNLGWSAAGQVIVKGLSSQSLNLGHSATAGVLAEGSAVNGLNLTWSAAGTVADKVWTEESAESDTWTGDSVESSTWTPDALAASSWSSDAAGGGGWVEDAAETNSWTEDLSI